MKEDIIQNLICDHCKKLEIKFQFGKNFNGNKILLKPHEFIHKKLIIHFTYIFSGW